MLEKINFTVMWQSTVWPVEVFKKCADDLVMYPLIYTLKSLESGILPQDWKTGHITSIYMIKAFEGILAMSK